MKKKIVSIILATTLVVNVAQANDLASALGGFILGVIVADRDDAPQRREPPPPPPRRESRLVPIFKTVCEWNQEYDVWGNPTRIVRTCREEIAGYREVYE